MSFENKSSNGPAGERSTPSSPPSSQSEAETALSPKPESEPKKHPLTWERTIEIAKLLATVWVALVGTFVTMQFNERQHELNRIEAIAKMLPHVSANTSDEATEDKGDDVAGNDSGESTVKSATGKKPAKSSPKGKKAASNMSRDGAIWAIFRTANNKVMLRDLAALFPADIYRVVSSIAVAGGLEHDQEALVALQVASEKLAQQYTDTSQTELASRLFTQAIHLKERSVNDTSPLYIVDLSTPEVESLKSDEQASHLVRNMIKLADLHLNEAESNKHVNTGHWQAKQLYKRARQVGLPVKTKEVQLLVATADEKLGELYRKDGHLQDGLNYLKEARKIVSATVGETSNEAKELDSRIQQLTGELNLKSK